MAPSERNPAEHLIRLAILDDNPFLRRSDGAIVPRAATFHRFAEAVVAAGPFARARYLVPVADAASGDPDSGLAPVDSRRLEVVPTAPFDGIEGYLRRGPRLVARNWPVIRSTIAQADLVWIKAPASNAPLALAAARRARRPFFTWVAGNAREVVRGQRRRQPRAALAALTAAGYDGVTRLLRARGPSVELDADLFTSTVTADEIAATRALASSTDGRGTSRATVEGPLRVAWAGRLRADKGVDDLLVALARVGGRGTPITLDVVGDGPDRARLERLAAELGIATSVRWHGYIGERGAYMQELRRADLFVLPSRAEGLPKVLVDAMAAGLPIIATRVGAVAALLGDGERGRLVPTSAPEALAAELRALGTATAERQRLREAGLAFAADHTLDAQAARLVAWMRVTFPHLPWPAGGA